MMQKTIINGTEVYQVTKEVIGEVLENQTNIEHYGGPHCLMWYYDETSGRYVGCDNVCGFAWVEDFSTKEKCIKWLIDEEE